MIVSFFQIKGVVTVIVCVVVVQEETGEFEVLNCSYILAVVMVLN